MSICNEFDGYLVDKCVPECVADVIGETIKVGDIKIKRRGDENNIYLHKNLLKDLKNISEDEEFPNIIFYGKPGTGKKVMLNLFLEMVFGKNVYNVNDEIYTVKSSGNVDNKVSVKQSDHHIVIEPNNNNFDRNLVRHVIVEYSKRKPLNMYKNKNSKNKQFKVVQINNLEDLSEGAQTSLRRTIEKYSKNCRFVMWTHSLSKVIKELRSRCPCFHIPTIDDKELFLWAYKISRINGININLEKLHKVIDTSNGNLKTILWKMDLYKYTGALINTYDQKMDILAKNIINQEDISTVRPIIQNFLTTNIKSNKIIIDLLNIILKKSKLNDKQIKQIIESAAEYDTRLSLSRRDIIHIEGYVVRIMNILK